MERFVVAGLAALVLAVPGAHAGKPAFSFQATAPGTVRAGSTAVVLSVRSSAPARVSATLYRSGRKLATWQTAVSSGRGRVRLALAPRNRRPGAYTLLVRATARSETIFRTLRFRVAG